MNDVAIQVEGLGKQYSLGVLQTSYRTIREQISTTFAAPFRWLLHSKSNSQPPNFETIWALKDISFEIMEGEVVGIIGPNGAGKTTLLKILSKITEPTLGRAKIHGRVGSLLEVGTGFHPELTGRENIYLNGAILGMRRIEINRKFDEIVAFAEVEKFLDTPVKRYSSGMYVRLAFAVAAHLEPEILLVDEVLAVGDAHFQEKCLGKMKDVARQGRTVLFISHNHQAVRRLCEKCIWLNEGSIRQMGLADDVVDAYLRTLNANLKAEDLIPDPPSQDSTNPVRILRLAVCDSDRQSTNLLYGDQSYTVDIEYEVTHPIKSVRVAALFRTSQGIDAFVSTDCDSGLIRGLDRVPGHYVAHCEIPANLLNQGRYIISVWIAITHRRQLRRRDDALIVDVRYRRGFIMEENRGTAVNPILTWNTERFD